MLSFSLLSPAAKCAVSGLLFFAALLQFGLLLYKYISTCKIKRCVFDTAVFVGLIMLLSYLTGSFSGDTLFYQPAVSCEVIITVSAVVAVYALIGIVREYRLSRSRLSPYSIKQALDNLNTGICFADNAGRIILINYTMARLAYSVIDSYPQTAFELQAVLNSDSCEYKAQDDKIWQFDSVSLENEGLEGIRQITAFEITELYRANEELCRENELLAQTNEKMEEMLERLADRIREQESLKLKMQIHNDIGTSLIAISGMIKDGEQEELGTELDQLQNAVSYFSSVREQNGGVEDSVKKAEKMGVKLIISGDSSEYEDIIAAAADECVTNCINHAGGDTVKVCVTSSEKTEIMITNNGSTPQKNITEGGGLSSLRRKVEDFGGRMTVISEPEFVLIIELGEEND